MVSFGTEIESRLPPFIWRTFRSIKAATMVTLGVSMLATSVVGISKPVTHFVFAEDGNLTAIADIIRRPDIHGVQMIYSWKQLEQGEGGYNFSEIETDLKNLQDLDQSKTLFVQLQDRFDVPGNKSRRIPNYLLVEPEYEGGLMMQVSPETHLPNGWQTKHWVLPVRKRFQALLSALAKQFDGRIAGLNLPESAIDYDGTLPTSLCDAYFQAEMENLNHASSVFKKSMVIQYVNAWPCETPDHMPYMTQAFLEASEKKTFGLGGPDVMPWNEQFRLEHSYEFFRKYRYQDQLSHVAMAVQTPDFEYINPRTNKTNTIDDFKSFSEDYLGADIIFWTSHVFNQTYPPPL